MLLSLAIILLFGLGAGWICKKLRLPPLLGMLIIGIAIGPYALNFIDNTVIGISAELRKIALIIILTRAGLSLRGSDLKKMGRPAIFMCFLPACFEIAGTILLAPKLLDMSLLDAAILGTVIAAVSPAVIVPKMLRLMEQGYGTARGIPQLILAGASVDDIFVIVLFSSFTGLAESGNFSAAALFSIPISIVFGILAGLVLGYALGKAYQRVAGYDTVKLIVLLCVAFLLVALEDVFSTVIPFSALIAVMCAGISMRSAAPHTAEKLSAAYKNMWDAAEVILFVLVGATVSLQSVFSAGASVIFFLFAVLVFRMIGVLVCLIRTQLSAKERIFCMIAYIPKATVQAAIGGIPLAMGLPCGEIVLTVAVLSILITAPMGAFFIDVSYRQLLHKS